MFTCTSIIFQKLKVREREREREGERERDSLLVNDYKIFSELTDFKQLEVLSCRLWGKAVSS